VDQAALAWLYSLADQERGVGWNPRASPDEQWKLGRTRALLDLAGAPDRSLRIALVAGTKGKGSTCAMLASILGAAGVRCGLFTKPHLQSYRERIRIDGTAITSRAFADAVRRLQSHVAHLPGEAGEPTTFEVTTALALDEFARQGCHMAVVEVGLGGRLDATNATEPFVSVITSISYDHTAILGRTLGAIALEKAGILRAGRPGLLAEQRPAAMHALRQACRTTGADCHVVKPVRRELALAGTHQWQNAGLAVVAARLMADVDDEAVERGLQRLRWPGRFEVVDPEALQAAITRREEVSAPGDMHGLRAAMARPERLSALGKEFGGGVAVVLDGAHNDASAEALANTLRTFAAGRPIHLVIGINRDKDARAVLRPLLPLAASVWATQTADNPRALPAVDLGRLCACLGVTAQVEADVAGAVGRAVVAAQVSASAHRATPAAGDGVSADGQGGVVCITGSLMLVGQARATLGLPVPERLW
jgi:dihydrofolate synthase / folylpolyglutamate synthase